MMFLTQIVCGECRCWQAMVSKLLNSIDQAAEDRSQDPTPMERSVMDRIMNSSSSIKT